MFRVKALYKTEIEVAAPVARVRKFFSDFTNFTELLPGIEKIRREPGGVARWTIGADTPVGRVRFSFPVQQTINRIDSIEWSPATNETENLLRYSVDLAAGEAKTVINITQQIELRRKRARELHPALGLIGEGPVNAGTQRRINEAIETFLARAKKKLEAD
jgi:carbon monoxide dehydrogenase subunit G